MFSFSTPYTSFCSVSVGSLYETRYDYRYCNYRECTAAKHRILHLQIAEIVWLQNFELHIYVAELRNDKWNKKKWGQRQERRIIVKVAAVLEFEGSV